MVYCCGGVSDVGNYRPNNEDSIFYSQKQVGSASICFAAVCDGIGGMKDGEIASQMISKSLSDWFASITSYCDNFDELCNSLLKRINMINLSIIEKTKVEDIQTGSTVAAVLIADGSFFAVNVGDSRIYRISQKVVQISKDDVVFVKTNNDKMRTKLSQCIGNSQNIYINTISDNVCADDAFIICSDGFYKHITDKKMHSSVRWLKSEKECLKRIKKMIEYVKQKGEKDNISAIIIKCVGKK